MNQFTIIYTYPDDSRIGSITVVAADQDASFLVAAKELADDDKEEVEIIVSIPGILANNRWMGPVADGWKTCNVEDYLKSMEEN